MELVELEIVELELEIVEACLSFGIGFCIT